MIFKPKAVDDDIADFIDEGFESILAAFAAEKPVADTCLVTPAPGFYVLEDNVRGPARAEALFRQTAAYCGIANWPVKLQEAGPAAPAAVDDLFVLVTDQKASGVFSIGQAGDVTITYASRDVEKPADLIATFAHEIAHYVLAGSAVEQEADPDTLELLTDLTAVYLGFGVFLANAAFEFHGFSETGRQGWSARTRGYLSERSLVYATALFCEIKGNDHAVARSGLKAKLAPLFDKALAQVRRRGTGERLRDLDRTLARRNDRAGDGGP